MEFLVDNYFWLLSIGIIFIMALIGYIAEKTGFGKIEKPKEEFSYNDDSENFDDEPVKEKKKSRKELKKEKKAKREEEKKQLEKLDKEESPLEVQEDTVSLTPPSLDEVVDTSSENLNIGMADILAKNKEDKEEEAKIEDSLKSVEKTNLPLEEESKENSEDDIPEELKAPLDLNSSLKEETEGVVEEAKPLEEKTLTEALEEAEQKNEKKLDFDKTVDLSDELGINLKEYSEKEEDGKEKPKKEKEGMEEFKI